MNYVASTYWSDRSRDITDETPGAEVDFEVHGAPPEVPGSADFGRHDTNAGRRGKLAGRCSACTSAEASVRPELSRRSTYLTVMRRCQTRYCAAQHSAGGCDVDEWIYQRRPARRHVDHSVQEGMSRIIR